MGKYVAEADLQIGSKFFRIHDPVTAALKKNDLEFLLQNGLIREQDETEKTAPGKTDQGKAEPGKKGRKKQSKPEDHLEEMDPALQETQDPK